jgi:hypothetical protein
MPRCSTLRAAFHIIMAGAALARSGIPGLKLDLFPIHLF